MKKYMLPLLVLAAIIAPARVGWTDPPAKPLAVRKLVADGRHNAFTALVRWQDALWLAFRTADSHANGEADIVVLRSSDGEAWSEALRLNVLPDDRDPQFLATPGRLLMYLPSLEGSKLTSFVTHTSDGQTWTKPEPVYQPQFILWKPFADGEGFLATAHKKVESAEGGKAREVHLIASRDGLAWEKVSTIRAGNWESETTVLRSDGDQLTAFIRTKYSVAGHIMEAMAPYAEWKERPAGVHLSGHSIHTFEGVTYLFSRTMDDAGANQGTMIYTYEEGSLKPYCQLPAGGDCSYPEAVQTDGEMLVSYYSTHEGDTNIYLARVPLKR